MKLLLCTKCMDLFNLRQELKTCKCGEVKGKYVNEQDAVTNGKGIALAIGNGSLQAAIWELEDFKEDWRGKNLRSPTQVLAWVRHHEGPTNPHSAVEDL